MQPNDQQGYYQPEQGQPAQPAAPPQPTATGLAPAVDPAQLQATLSEPTPAVSQPQTSFEAPSDATFDDNQVEDDELLVTWSAHEYLHQEKGTVWFVLFAIVILALIGLSVWTQAWSFTVLIVVIAAVVIVYARRPPRELTYSLTDEGLVIDGKLNQFSSFKSFGIIRDGEEFSVMLIPTQRFQPGVTVYFPEEAGEDIVDMLGSRLPMKDLKLDAVDRLVRLLRL